MLSIITVVFNDKNELVNTIESVREQKKYFSNFEYIIVDGASTDGTLNIINQNNDLISSYISEPDNGMYDAIHKGFLLSTGDILAWLNADDIYFPYTLSIVAQTFTINEQTKWITGIPTHMNSKSEVINVEQPKTYYQLFLKK